MAEGYRLIASSIGSKTASGGQAQDRHSRQAFLGRRTPTDPRRMQPTASVYAAARACRGPSVYILGKHGRVTAKLHACEVWRARCHRLCNRLKR